MSNENQYWSRIFRTPAVEWHPERGGGEHEGVWTFFVDAWKLVEEELAGRGLTFYFTASLDQVPPFGPKVVSIITNDEHFRIPWFWSKVGSVMKCHGGRPYLGERLLSQGPALATMTLVKYAWIVSKWIVCAAHAWSVGGPRRCPIPEMMARTHYLPLGYHAVPTAERVPFHERTCDVFFIGSIHHKAKVSKIRVRKPKEIARQELVDSLEALKKSHPELNIRVGTATGFVPHARGTAAKSVLSEEDYIRQLGNTKICVAPRGTSYETFRHFEGAGMGCVVISEVLPPAEFYDAAPFVRVSRWREIIDLVPALLADKSRLDQINLETAEWWQKYCTPRAVADYILRALEQDGVIERRAK